MRSKFCKEKPEGSSFTTEEGGPRHRRRTEESGGGTELGETAAGGSGCEMGPTQILPPDPHPRPAEPGSFCWARLLASGRGFGRQSLNSGSEKRDRRWRCSRP